MPFRQVIIKTKKDRALSKKISLLWKLLVKLSAIKASYKINFVNHPKIYKDAPIIWVLNHQRFFDFPIALRAIGHPVKTVSGRQNLYFIDRLWFDAMKVIWIDRKDKVDSRKAVAIIEDNLKSNQEILWFPEGTWNLSENLLMLPMKWGVVNTAFKTGAQIIPMLMEYDDNKKTVNIRYGPTMHDNFDDRISAINNLRDIMATERWLQWESQGIYKRADIDIEYERTRLWNRLKEYPPLDWEYERSIIFNPHNFKNIEPEKKII